MDVPGAFLQANMEDHVHMHFHGEMVDKLLEINLELYSPYIMVENGVQMMYVEMLKAISGTLCAAHLFWEQLQSKLIDVFIPNRYDGCVVNKMAYRKQLTVVWHVDDLNVSHCQGLVVESFISQWRVSMGKKHPL